MNGAPVTEHQSIYADGHSDWRSEPCDECSEHKAAIKATHKSAGPTFGNRTQMRDRDYASVHRMEQEIVANARRNGIEPERYNASQEKGYKNP